MILSPLPIDDYCSCTRYSAENCFVLKRGGSLSFVILNAPVQRRAAQRSVRVPGRRNGVIRITPPRRFAPSLDSRILGITGKTLIDSADHLMTHIEKILARVVVEDGLGAAIRSWPARRTRGLPAKTPQRLASRVVVEEPAIPYLMPEIFLHAPRPVGHHCDNVGGDLLRHFLHLSLAAA